MTEARLGWERSSTQKRASPLRSPPTTARVPRTARCWPSNGALAAPVTTAAAGLATLTIDNPKVSDATQAWVPAAVTS